MNKPVIYVVVNKSLGMSPGKLAAQVGHAVALVMSQFHEPHTVWPVASHRWIIVLEATNGEQLFHLHQYLAERDVNAYRVIDEGVNEIPAFSITALGVGILEKDGPEAALLKGLATYREPEPDVTNHRGTWTKVKCLRKK